MLEERLKRSAATKEKAESHLRATRPSQAGRIDFEENS